MADWTGSIISVDCGNTKYEGKIIKVDNVNQTISLCNVSKNSVPCQDVVTIRVNEIKNLKFLESTITNDVKNTENNSTYGSSLRNGYVRNSPINEESTKNKTSNAVDSAKKKLTKRSNSRKRPKDLNEECFSAPVDNDVLDIEFDFEKNLALFDKQAVFDEINAQSKSDHVKLVDCNRRAPVNYRPDENILKNDIPILKQITVSCKSTKEYVTDFGLAVPSVTIDFKKVLYEKGEELGFTPRIRTEMIGRAACEMVLHLVGGSHRLNPQNTHQKPTVVILCGTHLQGAQGISCARHLSNHCVNVTVLGTDKLKEYSLAHNELRLFSMCSGTFVTGTAALPSTVDLIVDALDSHNDPKPDTKIWQTAVRQWSVNQSKAPILCLDPPPNIGTACSPKFVLSPALPFHFSDENCGIHICDIGLPDGIFKKMGCRYSSPFGSKFVIPLYHRTN